MMETIEIQDAKTFLPAKKGIYLLKMEDGNWTLHTNKEVMPDIPGLYRFQDGTGTIGRATTCIGWALLDRVT